MSLRMFHLFQLIAMKLQKQKATKLQKLNQKLMEKWKHKKWETISKNQTFTKTTKKSINKRSWKTKRLVQLNKRFHQSSKRCNNWWVNIKFFRTRSDSRIWWLRNLRTLRSKEFKSSKKNKLKKLWSLKELKSQINSKNYRIMYLNKQLNQFQVPCLRNLFQRLLQWSSHTISSNKKRHLKNKNRVLR